MDTKSRAAMSINLASLVNSHDKPFVVIDRHYNIISTNQAYERKFGLRSEDVVGRSCYEVSHGKHRPCSEEGEDCPMRHVMNTGEPKVCAHLHVDADRHIHHVKVSAFPLETEDGELFLGEAIEEIETDAPAVHTRSRMVGDSPAFLACVDQLKVASSSDAPVLLQGETGTGKELAAEYIHQHSSRNLKPFQIVDSTVLTENLFESEMFGHVSGSFTGSTGNKAGLFELAEGGTIFLDEIGELPMSQQAKLLRVLESGQYRRVGGKHVRKANVRIICATNRHLWESVQSGEFREDLYYRIACLNIRLPSLRDRLEDVPQLARNLLEGINRGMRCSYHLAEDAYDCLKKYAYPGNVRELRNILFIAATHSHDREIDCELVARIVRGLPHSAGDVPTPAHIAESSQAAVAPRQQDSANGATLKEIERQHILELMERHGGNRKKVANSLGVSERTVYRKLKKLNLN